jgi:hypothetical protein
VKQGKLEQKTGNGRVILTWLLIGLENGFTLGLGLLEEK